MQFGKKNAWKYGFVVDPATVKAGAAPPKTKGAKLKHVAIHKSPRIAIFCKSR